MPFSSSGCCSAAAGPDMEKSHLSWPMTHETHHTVDPLRTQKSQVYCPFVSSSWVNGSLAVTMGHWQWPMTHVTHPKMVTHLTHDPLTHFHLWAGHNTLPLPPANRHAMRVSGGPTSTRCCSCVVNRSNRAKMSARMTVLLAVLLLSTICISTVHCVNWGNPSCYISFRTVCYKTRAQCDKHCTPKCLKRYKVKGRCREEQPPHSYTCSMCICEGALCGAVAFGANLLHTIYASCAAGLVIYMGRNWSLDGEQWRTLMNVGELK